MWEMIFQIAVPAIIGAASTGVPLWIQLRKAFAEIRQTTANADLDIKKKAKELSNADKINAEAEWRRVIDEKDKELVRLRAKDDEQEVKIENLLNRHIECKQNEARQDERAKYYERRSDEQGREIKALMSKILQLEKLIREKFDAFEHRSGEGTGEAAQVG